MCPLRNFPSVKEGMVYYMRQLYAAINDFQFLSEYLEQNHADSCFNEKNECRKLRWFVVDVFLRGTAEGLREDSCLTSSLWVMGEEVQTPVKRWLNHGSSLLGSCWETEHRIRDIRKSASIQTGGKSSLMQQWIVTGYCHYRQNVLWFPVISFLSAIKAIISNQVCV